jgi:chemotaxis protein MotB
MAVLNEQVAALRSQLSSLQALLDASEARDAQAQVQIESLGNRLNQALAQVAQEQRARAELEAERAARLEEEARRLEQEKRELESYRSEFFGALRRILGGRDDVRIEGDRFIFASEVLFAPGSATLSEGGRAQIARVARVLGEISGEIPDELDWIIRVDGHTDDTPLGGGSAFEDNWELSQARALSVVRYMVDELGFPPFRLAANGFGEYQPIARGDDPEALAQNRRIELKLTER